MPDFLTYVVEETLAGRSDRLKSYRIAVEVFGRPTDFDVADDPVVRTPANRLRSMLERHNHSPDNMNVIKHNDPKAGVPAFVKRSAPKPFLVARTLVSPSIL